MLQGLMKRLRQRATPGAPDVRSEREIAAGQRLRQPGYRAITQVGGLHAAAAVPGRPLR